MNTIILAIFYTIGAGVMSGSFALPSKYIRNWRFEILWFNYACWAYLFLPWLVIFILEPSIWRVYKLLPSYTWFILISGGFLFGLGQVCFARALQIIGMGLAFVINIGLGTGLGFLLPLIWLHPEDIWTRFGLVTVLGLLLIMAGLFVSYYAGRQRDLHRLQNQVESFPSSSYPLGVLLGVIAGISSAGQNFTFALTGNMQQLALVSGMNHLAAAIVVWPAFLSCAFVPYALTLLYLQARNSESAHLKDKKVLSNCGLTLLMAILWYGSLVIYSQAALWIGSRGPIVGWPLFMVFIILAANFWGWRSKEWEGCSLRIKTQVFLAMVLLVVAVVVLAYGATLSP